jgi:hypothetical protein
MFNTPQLSRSAVAIGLLIVLHACGGGEKGSPTSPSSTGAPSTLSNFKVATWNIRSGMGIRGFATTSWSSDTINCTDRSQPVNAWGMGLPQAELEKVRADPAVVAMALQEAWNCGSPTNVNGVLGFKTISRELNGTALIARFGFSGAIKYQQFDAKAGQWLIGGDVCLDAACTSTLPMFSAHFGDTTDDEIPNQAQRVMDMLAATAPVRLFMGDLNVFKIDTWNPKVPCTGDDSPGRVRTISLIEGAGYIDAWKATQNGEGWTGQATRAGCGIPVGNLYKRIDYVYSIGLRTIATERFGRAAPGADSPSDHVGLIAQLATITPRSSVTPIE